MKDCVFCKIVKGEIPAEKIVEDEKFMAFLSATPVYEGFTIVVPKKHFGSYVYKSMPEEQLWALHRFAKRVALLLDKTLGSERCVQVMEGLDVDHAHLKLFPKYKGVGHAVVEREIFVTDFSEIRKVAERIRKAVDSIKE